MSYWCRGATCGMCKVAVTAGAVRQDAALILTDEEKASGLALLCVAHPCSNLVVEA